MCEIYYSTQSLRTVNNSLISILKRCPLVLDARVCGVMLKKKSIMLSDVTHETRVLR